MKGIERCSKAADSEQTVPAKKILESIHQMAGDPKATLQDKDAPVVPQRLLRARETMTPVKLPSSSHGAIVPVAAANQSSGSAKNRKQQETGQGAEDSFVARAGDKSTPVFISYQSAYTERVLKLKRELEARGIPCWMATENMVGDVQDAIGNALMVAPAIVICFSHSYRDSMYVIKYWLYTYWLYQITFTTYSLH